MGNVRNEMAAIRRLQRKMRKTGKPAPKAKAQGRKKEQLVVRAALESLADAGLIGEESLEILLQHAA